jgi:hypothetical protein
LLTNLRSVAVHTLNAAHELRRATKFNFLTKLFTGRLSLFCPTVEEENEGRSENVSLKKLKRRKYRMWNQDSSSLDECITTCIASRGVQLCLRVKATMEGRICCGGQQRGPFEPAFGGRETPLMRFLRLGGQWAMRTAHAQADVSPSLNTLPPTNNQPLFRPSESNSIMPASTIVKCTLLIKTRIILYVKYMSCHKHTYRIFPGKLMHYL